MKLLAPFTARVGAGGVLTFVGERAGQTVYWYLEAVDPRVGYGPWPAVGTLMKSVTRTDASRTTANAYHGPGHTPKIRVGMGYRVGEVTVGQPSGLWDRATVKVTG